MTNHVRQVAVLIASLVGAALLLLGNAAQTVRAVPESQRARFDESGLSLEKQRVIEAGQEKLGSRQASVEPQERRIDRDPEGNPIVAGELIVTYKDGTTGARKAAVKSDVEARPVTTLPEIDAEAVSLPEVKSERSREARQAGLERKKNAMERDPTVEAVEYNHVGKIAAVNDPLHAQQWGSSHIRAPQAWDTTAGAGSIIAVVDTGVSNTHPDVPAIAQEWDYVNGDADANDGHGHGTHVAGIAAAKANNATGIAGVAHGAQIFDYGACNSSGGCPTDKWISAVIDAANNGADVINLSLGGPGDTLAQENAVSYAWNKGVVVVASAGNEAQSGNDIGYPAAYPPVIAVGSIDNTKTKSSYSNYGSYVDVVAPGGKALSVSSPTQATLSTVPSSGCSGCFWWRNRTAATAYEAWAGTSMAAPHVTGLAALLAAQGLAPSQIRSRIERTVTDLGTAGKDIFFGKGLINAHAAVTNDTAPTISGLLPTPKSSTSDRAPTIQATITDAQTDLLRGHVALILDGDKVASSSITYDSATDRLTYTPALAPGTHRAKVVAVDPQGMRAYQVWFFTVL